MEKGERKKFFYGVVSCLIILLVVWLWFLSTQNKKDITFVINPQSHWYTCWKDTLNLSIDYEISSSYKIDILFTPTEKDAQLSNESYIYYPFCSNQDVLNYKGSCAIDGKGCLVLVNKDSSNAANINLKYSAKTIK